MLSTAIFPKIIGNVFEMKKTPRFPNDREFDLDHKFFIFCLSLIPSFSFKFRCFLTYWCWDMCIHTHTLLKFQVIFDPQNLFYFSKLRFYILKEFKMILLVGVFIFFIVLKIEIFENCTSWMWTQYFRAISELIMIIMG